MTCPSDNALAQLVDGKLDDIARVTIERHLDACGGCSELVAELAQMLSSTSARRPAERVLPPGITARAWRAEAPRTRAEIFALWQSVLGELAALHRAGTTRAVSPDHVFVDASVVRLADFPVAKTSGYVAPEVLRGGVATARSDQFAACVAIWEALAGERPFTGVTAGALVVATTVPPVPPDPSFAPLVRGLAADPDARWPDLDTLAASLAKPPQASATITALVMAVVIVLLALVARGML